ncbi:hypothetical protein GCM10010124_41370 [Pilimelia terevasa]|uniref:Uncharacterized protein n=1 Tax=Pilimelia terevasa TaxID=53372 RepID=A0A8J3FKX7_9ACTN|nr:hypothetical protein GCM10010124_41370 [Pilimelia terevasa]
MGAPVLDHHSGQTAKLTCESLNLAPPYPPNRRNTAMFGLKRSDLALAALFALVFGM